MLCPNGNVSDIKNWYRLKGNCLKIPVINIIKNNPIIKVNITALKYMP